ncbi:Chain length regulator (Capsular polysaccharide biosynthesis) [Moritella viscosa]|uniref:GumC family protein n=1 Tax=Moritella viscosa TaxID=80854 RepID=UPI000508F0F8|nr:capsule biosynthesis protein [Moritella viscosa]CED60283.1 chain length regulator (capsular polysaccharide biosynthesis) [Moritella viscosa]SGZ05264.1 Chain length regulator (Capsular polysaccharide biosynthesis) [Moritella viscosa]SHO14011.1 Chain length regulator (Capsular polysaccharide biosynthesis) [Moritella viscosa]SHO23478.1 Chain length regulator (Capsular polysaccharide biosynthesis) [Moritella viscosa]
MGIIIWGNIYRFIEIMWRRRYYLGISVVIAMLSASLISLFTDKRYDAHTSILVQESALLNPFLEDLSVSFNLEQRIVALRVLVHSRHILLTVANQNELIDTNSSYRERDLIVEQLSDAIILTLSGADLVIISLSWDDPNKMESILSSVSQLFIDSLMAPSRASIISSEEFLLAQLELRRNKLVVAEEKMASFRRKHLGVLPELFIQNNQTLFSIYSEIRDKDIELSGAYGQLNSLKLKLAQTNPVIGVVEEQIVAAEAKLSLLKASYTRSHSKVQSVELQLNNLKNEQKKLLSKNVALTDEQLKQLWNLASVVDNGNGESKVPSLLLSQLENLQSAQSRVIQLENEVAMLRQQSEHLTSNVAMEADVAKELSALKRDLTVNTKLYHDLLNRHEMAKVTGELGRHEEPEKIKVIDRPFTPGYPSNLSIFIYIIIGLFTGVGSGIGLAVIVELLDDTLWHIKKISLFDDIDIIVRLPAIDYEKDVENENHG